eukprot:833152-Amphidinium_carterae.2
MSLACPITCGCSRSPYRFFADGFRLQHYLRIPPHLPCFPSTSLSCLTCTPLWISTLPASFRPGACPAAFHLVAGSRTPDPGGPLGS